MIIEFNLTFVFVFKHFHSQLLVNKQTNPSSSFKYVCTRLSEYLTVKMIFNKLLNWQTNNKKIKTTNKENKNKKTNDHTNSIYFEDQPKRNLQ